MNVFQMWLGAALLAISCSAAASYLNPRACHDEGNSHHSLKAPLDKALSYWSYGGATVATRQLIRLTPNTQDRQGWLWNDYPIESENWEVEFKFEVYSNPHFGGDGFGFWILSGDQDPSFSSEPDFLNGPIFGMKKDFQGIGVMLDVYDNDNKRNNPSIFVLNNMEGDVAKYNHDNDYEDDMVKEVPDVVPGHIGDSSSVYRAHKCVVDFRNNGKETSMLVKFLHKVLHVYTDVGDGYKFCLAVELDYSFVDHHIAFSAATGQVADSHDIKALKGCYLSEDDEDFDDSLMDHFGTSSAKPQTWRSLFFSLVTLTLVACLGLTGWQLYSLRQLSGARIDLVRICMQLNKTVTAHWCAQGMCVFVLLCLFQWIPLLLNLPIVAFRIYLLVSNQVRFSEQSLSGQGQKGHNADDLSAFVRLLVNALLYSVVVLLCLYRYFYVKM